MQKNIISNILVRWFTHKNNCTSWIKNNSRTTEFPVTVFVIVQKMKPMTLNNGNSKLK